MGFPLNIPLTGAQILTTTTDKRHPLGSRGVTRDGRSFRYSRAGGSALKAAYVVQSAVQETGLTLQFTGTTKIRANSSYIKILGGANTSGGITTANEHTDGFIYAITSSTGVGLGGYAQIKSHTTETKTATGVVVINLVDGDAFYSPTTNFGTTDMELQIVKNPYDKVVVKPAGIQTAMVVGVPPRAITASHYFWLQTWGPCPVRVTGSIDVGYPMGWSSGATAGVADMCTSTKATSSFAGPMSLWRNLIASGFGVAMSPTVTAGNCVMVFLKLAP